MSYLERQIIENLETGRKSVLYHWHNSIGLGYPVTGTLEDVKKKKIRAT